jgi:hypothetical protein
MRDARCATLRLLAAALLSPEQRRLSDRYIEDGYWPQLSELVWAVASRVLLLVTGAFRRLGDRSLELSAARRSVSEQLRTGVDHEPEHHWQTVAGTTLEEVQFGVLGPWVQKTKGANRHHDHPAVAQQRQKSMQVHDLARLPERYPQVVTQYADGAVNRDEPGRQGS